MSWKFVETYKVTVKFIWKFKEPRIATTILKKNNKVEGLTFTLWFQDNIKRQTDRVVLHKGR